MGMLWNRPFASPRRVLAFAGCVVAAVVVASAVRGADEPAPDPSPTFRQYCFPCHGAVAKPRGGISLAQLTSAPSVGENFASWEKVAIVLETNRMPPKGMPQPTADQRRQAVAWIRSELSAFARKTAGDPGRVTVRRLTSGEYEYSIEDLTGYHLDTGIDASSDSVGGEGFTNFGDVQFMQDANLERYLQAAKLVADHAVIGSGPLQFYSDPGKTGYELSAIARIREIYSKYGFRTVSGEGGRPFGLDKYGKALYASWRYRHRAALGEPGATLERIAAREGVSARFAQHIWSVLTRPKLAYPSSEVAARFQKLPEPGADPGSADRKTRAACTEIEKYLTTWPSWLFARGDIAAGGAGDESPLQFNDKSLKVEAKHHFIFFRGGRGGGAGRGAPPPGPAKIYLNVSAVNPAASGKPVVIWRNATLGFRAGFPGRGGNPAPPAGTNPAGAQPRPAPPAGSQTAAAPPTPAPPPPAQAAGAQPAAAGSAVFRRNQPPPGPRVSLRSAVSEETAARLRFGKSIDGTPLGPDDFASDSSVWFEVPMPKGMTTFDLQVDAEIGADRDQVFRILLSDREDGRSRGIPTRTLLGDPLSNGYQQFRAGVLEFASLLPPNSHSEPTPADKDPIPDPFDSTYNVPEHDAFDTLVKYIRDDRFVYENMLDDATRRKLDQAWTDLYDSFEYHDNYLGLLAEHYKLDLKGKRVARITDADLAAFPAEARKYMTPVVKEYRTVVAAEAAARGRHLEDCLEFASRAWRRPLTEKEKQGLRAFYDKTFTLDPDHRKAIRAVIARILVSPAFLYRVEHASDAPPPRPSARVRPIASISPAVRPLTNWEMASRLSYFLWASIPDDELRRAAAAGELTDTAQLRKQVQRMLADPKARRLATEFFGQWLGFYHFDQFKGVDIGRFPEFTNEVRDSMYDEAVSFFEYIIRKNRPLREMLSADYTFLDKPLAKFYGVSKDVTSDGAVEYVAGANVFHRGGILRLGAILTATSAPLRTSPVKRGDWVLRRILGTPTPPPPANAGSLPADDKLFGGLTLKAKLEVHKRNATCANCHLLIDPLGFSLEHYDSTGRWRETYAGGQPIEDSAALVDKTEIDGVDGLLRYLESKETQVRRTLSYKLVGYALGRTVQISDRPLIDEMAALGEDATFSQLAALIVTGKQFRNRVGSDNASAAKHVAAASSPAVRPAASRQAPLSPPTIATAARLESKPVSSGTATAPSPPAAAVQPEPVNSNKSDMVGKP